MRPLVWLGLVGMIIILLAGSSYCAYETPTSRGGCQIEPYAPVFGRMLDALHDECDEQGYDVKELLELVVLDLTPEVRLDNFVSRLENGDGVFGWGTAHGDVGLAVEAYEHTQSGWYASVGAYQNYLAQGYRADEIGPDEHRLDGYHIAVKPALILRRYRSANSIVYMGGCQSMSYASCWPGTREVLGYAGTVSTYLIQSEANTFWSRMNGEMGKAYRHVGGARSGLTLARSGPGGGNTVLSPTVVGYYPVGGTPIGRDSVAGCMVFDAKMDTGLDPGSIVVGDAYLRVKNESWSRGAADTLKYILKSVREGNGYIGASGQSEGGMLLDGNTLPYGTDGEGPNGDSYVIEYDCLYTDPNYASRFGSQWAYSERDVVVVGWHAEAEIGTSAYVVEATDGDDWDHGWEQAGQAAVGEVLAPGIYSIPVAGGYRFYRIVEIDERGKRGVSRPMKADTQKPDFVRDLIDKVRFMENKLAGEVLRVASGCPVQSVGIGSGLAQSQSVPDWVFYGPDSLLAECGPAVAWLESNGLDVDTGASTSPDY